MPGWVDPEEIDVTEEERRAAQRAAKAPGEGSAIGSAVGTAAGGALGALGLLVPGLGAVTIPAGMSIGGAAGNVLGGMVGQGEANAAEKVLSTGEERRAKKLTKAQLQQRALDELLKTG